MGMEHGTFCVGCCWVLMVLLITVGLGSLPWMGLLTLIIFAEKVLPQGEWVTRIIAGLLLALGLLALLRPEWLMPVLP